VYHDPHMPRKHVARIDIARSWCKGCGICVAFCPKDVLELDGSGIAVAARTEDCISCEICERMCPDLAVRLIYADADASPSHADAAGAGGSLPAQQDASSPVPPVPGGAL